MAVNVYDKDEELDEKVSFTYFSMLKKYVSPHTKKLILVILTMIVSAVIDLLPPFFISVVLDKFVPEGNYKGIVIIGGFLLAGSIISYLMLRFRPILSHTMSMDIIKNIRSDLFKHMQNLPFTFFDSRPHGKIMVRVVNYINSISGLLSDGIVEMVTNIFKMVVILCFMFAMDVEFTLVCLAGMPVFVVALLFIRKSHRKSWQKYSAKNSNLNAYIQESISGMKITQSFAREDKNAEIFDSIAEDVKKSWMKSARIGNITPYFVSFLSTLTLIIVYARGTGRIANSSLEIGTLIAFASYVSRFWDPLTVLTNIYNQIVNVAAYVERIFQMMSEPLVIENLPDAKPIGDVEGRVEYENVTFSYEENSPVILKDVSFKIEKGETIAFVGPTGAGKSTVINLLARFYDVKDGRILIDGKDIKHLTLSSLRKNMGIMLQESFLFSGTIMDNIRYSKLDATDDEVIEAAKTVCAHDFIMEFPDGYKTMITEGGTSLSVGQKQLIAFARVLLADPKILILDEATSSIDTETEIALQKGLDRLLEGRTSFIIAHRLSTIKNSSRIMYIANQKVEECGTHEELLDKKGKYYELYQAQYKFIDNI